MTAETHALRPPGDATAPADLAAPHVVAAMLAGALFVGGLCVLSASAESLVSRDIRALAGSLLPQKTRGLVVQNEALEHDDLLLLYGSSDVRDDRTAPYHARDLFARAPSGFVVVTVGEKGLPLLATMENVAALGAALRGKKVAISLAPGMFLWDRGVDLLEGYAGNFSPLHALALVLSPDLSPAFKQQVARRLLTYPDTLESNRILEQTVRLVADGSTSRRVLYSWLLPVARAQRRLLRMQDELLVWAPLFRARPAAPPPAPRTLDWPALEADAIAQFRAQATHNPFGVSDRWWKNHEKWTIAQRASSSDKDFEEHLSRSETWLDLEQLLQALNELGAEPLLLSMPFHRAFMEYAGVSAEPLRLYYARLREVAARHHVRAVVFEDHETDGDFFYDLWSHLSQKGWVYYDRALDAFYHDALR